MKTLIAMAMTALMLSACGSDEKTTVVEKQPIVVQQPAPVVINK